MEEMGLKLGGLPHQCGGSAESSKISIQLRRESEVGLHLSNVVMINHENKDGRHN